MNKLHKNILKSAPILLGLGLVCVSGGDNANATLKNNNGSGARPKTTVTTTENHTSSTSSLTTTSAGSKLSLSKGKGTRLGLKNIFGSLGHRSSNSTSKDMDKNPGKEESLWIEGKMPTDTTPPSSPFSGDPDKKTPQKPTRKNGPWVNTFGSRDDLTDMGGNPIPRTQRESSAINEPTSPTPGAVGGVGIGISMKDLLEDGGKGKVHNKFK